MANAYTPGLIVTDSTTVTKERKLPIKGRVTVKKDDPVTCDTIVATADLPGNIQIINLAGKLGVEPHEIRSSLIKNERDNILRDEMIAKTKGFFGLFSCSYRSPVDGSIENISDITGQILIRERPVPVSVDAFIDGVVKEVLEDTGVSIRTQGAFIQGIFGIGNETYGDLFMPFNSISENTNSYLFKEDLQNRIIVIPDLISFETFELLRNKKVKAIIASAIDDYDLKKILGFDLGVAITGSEETGITLVITEGFGNIKMSEKTFEILKKNNGKKASVNGATQIRAGVIRPEIIIPDKKNISVTKSTKIDKTMNTGRPVRVIREPYFGLTGKISSLPEELIQLESETYSRVAEIETLEGKKFLLPRANIELIEE